MVLRGKSSPNDHPQPLVVHKVTWHSVVLTDPASHVSEDLAQTLSEIGVEAVTAGSS